MGRYPLPPIELRSGSCERYGDLSRRVIATLSTFTPDVEQYSSGKAFIHVTFPSGSAMKTIDLPSLQVALHRVILRYDKIRKNICCVK